MLSILIPTYNYTITNLVESLSIQLKQIDFPYEILVLDDCSTNNELIEANKNITQFSNCFYIQQTANKGRTATRQTLAETAQYNWLLFMDADVLPKNNQFIRNFDLENQKVDVVFGGIAYETSKPESDKILRWKYGKAREAKPVSEREKMPYLSIISGCLLIKKTVFLKANTSHQNYYGSDVVFCRELQKMKANIKHIDNAVLHLGLESNSSFIEKTKKGLQSLHQFEKEQKIPEDYRPIQKAYQSLKKNGALKLFMKIMKTFDKAILKNLKSSSPSLFLFDLYRLSYYAHLQS